MVEAGVEQLELSRFLDLADAEAVRVIFFQMMDTRLKGRETEPAIRKECTRIMLVSTSSATRAGARTAAEVRECGTDGDEHVIVVRPSLCVFENNMRMRRIASFDSHHFAYHMLESIH